MTTDFRNTTEHVRSAEMRQVLMSDALHEEDQKTSDFFLLAIVFFSVVGACTFLAFRFGIPFGPIVLVPAMGVGIMGVGFLASRLAKRREARDALIRAERQSVADAELVRKLAAMKKERFEKGL